jgi:hypothetical protein
MPPAPSATTPSQIQGINFGSLGTTTLARPMSR